MANTASVKTATDGSKTPVAILVDDVDASTMAIKTACTSDGRVQPESYYFDDSDGRRNLKTALRPLAIFLKDSAQAPLTTS